MGGGRADVPGQALACAGGSACALPGGLVRVVGGIRGEGRQVGHHQQVGRAPAPVPEIVLRVVPVGLGHVEGPVPDLPPCASAGGDFGDIGVRDVEVGDEAVAAGRPAAGPGYLDLQPGDADRTVLAPSWGERAAFVRSFASGATAREFEPSGKAAGEVARVREAVHTMLRTDAA